MKFSALFGSIVLLVLGNAAAFAPVGKHVVVASSALRAAGELVAEPEGGEEISPVKTMAGSRMKNMGEAEGLSGVRSEEDAETQGTINKYWLTAKVEGSLVREIHQTVLKERQEGQLSRFPQGTSPTLCHAPN